MLEIAKKVDELCRKHKIDYWIDAGTYLGAVRHQGFLSWDDDFDMSVPMWEYERLMQLIREELLPENPHLMLYNDNRPFPYFTDFLGDTRYVRGHLYPIKVDFIKIKSIPNTPEAIQKDKDYTNITAFLYNKFVPQKVEDKQLFIDNVVKGSFFFKGKRFIQKFNEYLENQKEKKEENIYSHGFNSMFEKRERDYQDYDAIFPLKEIQFEDTKLFVPNNDEKYLGVLFGPDYMTPPPKEMQVPQYGNFSKAILPTWATKKLIWILYYLKEVKNSFMLIKRVKEEKEKY